MLPQHRPPARQCSSRWPRSGAWAAGTYQKLGSAWAKVSAGREQGAVSPDDLVELVRAFRRAAPATTPSLALSDSPLFQHRLLLDRLAVTGPRPLPLRGVVSIRWRTGGDDWSEPMRVVAASSPAPTDPD